MASTVYSIEFVGSDANVTGNAIATIDNAISLSGLLRRSLAAKDQIVLSGRAPGAAASLVQPQVPISGPFGTMLTLSDRAFITVGSLSISGAHLAMLE